MDCCTLHSPTRWPSMDDVELLDALQVSILLPSILGELNPSIMQTWTYPCDTDFSAPQ